MTKLLLLTVFVYPILISSVFVHELGHAIMAWFNGYTVHSFGIGLARPFWVLNLRGMRIYFGLRRLTSGLTFSQPCRVFPSRWRQASVYAGGVLANLFCAFAAVCLVVVARNNPMCVIVAGFTAFWNASMFLSILIPIRAEFGRVRLRTDGLLILQVLRWRSVPATVPQRLHARGLQDLWRSIGDQASLYYQLLDSAIAWVELGHAERARQLYQQADARSWQRSAFASALLTLVHAMVERVAKNPEAAQVSLDEAEKAFTALGDEGGLFLAAWERAAQRSVDDPDGALTLLDRLAAHRLAAARSDLAATVLAARLAIQLEQRIVDPKLWAQYEARTTAFDFRPWTVELFTARARCHESQGDDAGAEPAYRTALAAARSLYEEMRYPEDRLHFLACQNRLVVDARMCFHRRGRTLEEVADLDIPRSPRELKERQRMNILERRNRHRRIAAILLAVFGIPLRFLLWIWHHAADWEPSASVLAIPVYLGFTILVLGFSLFCLIAGSYVPSWRFRGGKLALGLLAIAWAASLIADFVLHSLSDRV
jgi:hypothetical protein